MSAPLPPAGLVADLRAFDPSLRIRWGKHTHKWFVEKKLPPRHPSFTGERPNPLGHSARAKDAFDGWREGYVVAAIVPHDPELLNREVIVSTLERNSLWNGGPEALNRRLDEQIEKEEAAVDRRIDLWAEQGSREWHDRLAWDQGRRVSMFDPVPVVGEQKEGFVVLDRRIKG